VRFRRSVRSGAAGEQKVEAPNEAESEWVKKNVDVAKALVAAHRGDDVDAAVAAALPNLADLDEAYAAWYEGWQAQPPANREDPNPYINAVGMAFGQRFVDELGFRWAVVTDEHGTEIAVHGDPHDFLVFPPNLVAKRFERGETRFLEFLYTEIAGRVRELRD
jgi:hypothetical protein